MTKVLKEHLEWMAEQQKWLEDNKPWEVADDGKADHDGGADERPGCVA